MKVLKSSKIDPNWEAEIECSNVYCEALLLVSIEDVNKGEEELPGGYGGDTYRNTYYYFACPECGNSTRLNQEESRVWYQSKKARESRKVLDKDSEG